MAVLIGIAAWVSRAGAGPAAAVRNGPAATAATWTGDMTGFTRQPTAAPGPVSDEADMAFDRSRGVVVLWDHGCSRLVMGFTGGCQGQVDQAWTWDGRGWHDQHTATSPKAVGQGAMFYDPRLGEVVYLNRVGQAWAWSGSGWRSLTIAGMPRLTQPGAVANSEQLLVAAGYDEGRNLLVIALPSTTWTWNGSRWAQIDGGIEMPLTRSGATDLPMAFDEARGNLVLFISAT